MILGALSCSARPRRRTSRRHLLVVSLVGCLTSLPSVESFGVAVGATAARPSTTVVANKATRVGATATTDDDNTAVDLTRPSYDIEPLPVRIGHGFDIHRLAPLEIAGQPLVISGVTIDHKPQPWLDVHGQYGDKGSIHNCVLGTVAHSDGDVVYHSVVDAIFGALTLPDIGQVFQDSDPRWKGCDSSKFVQHAYAVMQSHGYQIGNLDVTLILERPKVAQFKPAMKDNLVQLLHTTPGRVNLKARTHEKVDSVGELRSLACHVVLTLERRIAVASEN